MVERTASAWPRIGILSAAHYHANFWGEVFAQRGMLVGIWDDEQQRGIEAAQRLGTMYFHDLDALCRVCTAVAVCSETSRHPDLVERAAAHGLAILVEKPLAVSTAEGTRIAHAVHRHGVLFMQSFPKRLDPVNAYLKRLIDADEIGPVHLVRIRHGHHYGLTDDFRRRWYVQDALSGGGALIDEGIHGADLLAWLFGMPAAVSAVVSHAALNLPVEDLAVATYTFNSGLIAELTASFCFVAADTSIEIYGKRGTVLVSAVDLASRDITHERFVRICRRVPAFDGPVDPQWETVPITPQFKVGQFHQQSAHAFVLCLLGGTPVPVTLDNGLQALRMIEAAYRSAHAGCSVPIQL